MVQLFLSLQYFLNLQFLIGILEMMSELPNVYKLRHLDEISYIIKTIEESFDNNELKKIIMMKNC